ncbi:MAG TPA: hypothetical protein VIG64_01565, partial [Actinomycetota bacterium]
LCLQLRGARAVLEVHSFASLSAPAVVDGLAVVASATPDGLYRPGCVTLRDAPGEADGAPSLDPGSAR